MTDIVKLYNPANASAISPEDIAKMRSLTSAQIKELATAYSNLTMQRAYLLIIDSTKAAEKQLPTLSSWENLYNLREKNGQRKYVAYGFKGAKKPAVTKIGRARTQQVQVVDLSDAELMSLPGFKTKNFEIPAAEVPVRKIHKTKTPDNA